MAVKEQVANHFYTQPVRLAQTHRQTNIPPRSSRQSAQPYQRTSIQRQRVQPQVADDVDEDDDDDLYPQRSRSSVVVRRPSPSLARQADTEPEPPEGKKQRSWLFYAGLLLLIMLLGWLLFNILGSWIQNKLNDFTYGNPRTYQTDQDVGHYGRISHFLCINLNGEIEVLETQKGHPEVAKIYVVMVLPTDQASLPVTISFQNIKGYGSIDAIVHFGSTEIPLYNNGTTFQSQPPTK